MPVTDFFFAIKFKTPDYKKGIQYNWERPDFNPEDDVFMKHFDENGNFVNTPKPEEESEEIIVSPTITYSYVYKETPNDAKQSD